MKAVLKKILKKIIPARFHKITKRVYLTGKNILLYASRDIGNKIKYGPHAPIFAERIWINPLDCTKAINVEILNQTLNGTHSRKASGKVINESLPFKKAVPVESNKKVNSCIEHWLNGVAWKDTGVYEYMEELIGKRGKTDECSSVDDVIKRYRELDGIFNQVKKERKLKTKQEINPNSFREWGGILIHIGPEGEPYFGGGGCHRLAIALILGLCFPAQIGVVHRSAIPHLSKFRQKRRNKMLQKILKHYRQKTLLSAVAGKLKRIVGRRGREKSTIAWQLRRDTSAKFDLILPILQELDACSVLDVGCNAGEITRLIGEAGFFCVGIDKRVDFGGVKDPLEKACIGSMELNISLIDKLPLFDVILLLSVHHQMIKSFGDEHTKHLVAQLAHKAKKAIIVEFAALNRKYSDDNNKQQFLDNDESSIIYYAAKWLKKTLPGWDYNYIGKSPESAKEPYRFLFKCTHSACRK